MGDLKLNCSEGFPEKETTYLFTPIETIVKILLFTS